jgi:carbon monoxide dehydrogenase subunit G
VVARVGLGYREPVSVVQVSVDVDASPERVWSVVADPRNLVRWDRHVSGVRDVPPEGLDAGVEYTTDIRFLGVRAHSTSRVVELRPPEYSKIRLGGLVEGTVETWLEPLDGGGRTRLRHRVEYRFIGGPLGALAARAVKALGVASILRHGALAQKRQAEEG